MRKGIRRPILAFVLAGTLSSCSSSGTTKVRTKSPSTEPTVASTSSSSTTTTLPVQGSVTRATVKPAATTTSAPAVGPGQAAVTIINDYSASVTVKINGTVHRVNARTRVGPFGVTPGAGGNDVYEITAGAGGCGGMGGANGSLQDHGAHTLHIATSTITCPGGTSAGQKQFTAWIDPGHQGI